ncbi:MAG TPA: carbohydrate ABC transporter permease [Chloroflexota bacterium]|nr:carbohydrate ABC transporter permease [Chloroflexota bacterium]
MENESELIKQTATTRWTVATAHALGRLTGSTVFYAVISAGALLMVMPMIWMLTTSFKGEQTVFDVPIQWIAVPLHVENYARAYGFVAWPQYYFNSFFVAVAQVVLNLSVCSAAGFGFAKYRFPGRTFCFLLVLSTLMIPFQVIMVPLFIVTRQLGWLNSYAGLIIPGAVGAFGVFLMRQFMVTLPDELFAAARIDGASELRLFWGIAIPLSKPALAALAIFTFTGSWDNLLWPLIVTTKSWLFTLPLGLAGFNSEYGNDYTGLMAASTAATIPLIILFALLQKQFVEGIVMTGLKA